MVAFDGKSFVSRICIVFTRGESTYALCSGRCATSQAYLVSSDGDALPIGPVAYKVWDEKVWGMDFSVVRITENVPVKPWHVRNEPVIGTLSSAQIKEYVGHSNVAVAGYNEFELIATSENGARTGFHMILHRKKGGCHTPVTGDPVTIVVGGRQHILVGMMVAHVLGEANRYIAEPMDWFIKEHT